MITVCIKCNREFKLGNHTPGSPIHCSCGNIFLAPAAKPFFPELLRCGSCGGSISATSMRCEYCNGAVKAFDPGRYCARCLAFLAYSAQYCSWCGALASYAQQIPEQSAYRCPRDNTLLTGVPVGGAHGEECQTCGGLWLRLSDFRELLEQQEAQPPVAEKTPNEKRAHFQNEVQYLKCPECAVIMNRQNYQGISGTIIDRCYTHGVWLDRHELYDIARFIRNGGLDDAATRRRQERERAEKRRATGVDLQTQESFVDATIDVPPALEILSAIARLLNVRVR